MYGNVENLKCAVCKDTPKFSFLERKRCIKGKECREAMLEEFLPNVLLFGAWSLFGLYWWYWYARIEHESGIFVFLVKMFCVCGAIFCVIIDLILLTFLFFAIIKRCWVEDYSD